MKNSFGRFLVCSIAATLFATAANAEQKHIKWTLDAEEQAARASAGPGSIIDTDFEEPLWCAGFFCGPEFAACNNAGGTASAGATDCGAATPNRAGWWTSSLNRHCNEPHVDTINPDLGVQHLRFSREPLLTSGPACGNYPGFATSCRTYLASPNDDAVLGPATLAFEMANDTLGGAQMQILIFDASGLSSTYFFFGTDGDTLRVNNGETNFPYHVDGTYHTVEITVDICSCTSNLYYDGTFVDGLENCSYFDENSSPPLSNNLEFVLIRTNNGPGNLDIDNLRITRAGECPPSDCGNGTIEFPEQCDPPSASDVACGGGACLADCTCDCFAEGDVNCTGDVADATVLDNGPHTIEGPHGGWFIYDMDSPAVGIDTCGLDNTQDSFLLVWGLPEGGGYYDSFFVGYNDDCQAGFYGNDPYASCWGRQGFTCSNDEDQVCDEDLDCITGFFCEGGGNAFGLCGNDANCQGYCLGSSLQRLCSGGLNDGQPCEPATAIADCGAGFPCVANPCAADAECQETVCTTGPGFLLNTTCSAPGADAECTGFACGFPACAGAGDPCIDDADCGGNAGENIFCTNVLGTCATRGVCSQDGTCEGDASCDGPFIGSPYESCLCVGDALGLTLLIQLDYFAPQEDGDILHLNIEKRRTCDEPITSGMCCDVVGGSCTDGWTDAGASCTAGQVFVEGKDCNPEACPLRLGACCDGLKGICTDSYAGLPATHEGEAGVPIGMCQIGGGACAVGQCQWNEGLACDDPELTCAAATGACCNSAAGPLATEGTCEVTTINGCTGEKQNWFKGAGCGDIDCPANFVAIPTVSEWGLVVLTLLLLIGAKVYFGRRRVAMA
jgi:hypothetical protein